MEDRVIIPECEVNAFNQIRQEHYESDEEARENDTMILSAILSLLLDRGLINVEDLEKKYYQCIHDSDEAGAVAREEWVADMREKCPTISQRLDQHFGPDAWSLDDVNFDCDFEDEE